MLAAVIMFTSLAPSPTAKVVILGNARCTKVTISCFYFGDTRQATTAQQLKDISANLD
jgi:elongation factor P hydroxylase